MQSRALGLGFVAWMWGADFGSDGLRNACWFVTSEYIIDFFFSPFCCWRGYTLVGDHRLSSFKQRLISSDNFHWFRTGENSLACLGCWIPWSPACGSQSSTVEDVIAGRNWFPSDSSVDSCVMRSWRYFWP